MPNLTDYLQWRGDLSFSASPLSEVDNLIFGLLSYIDLDGIVPPPGKGRITVREAAKEYFFVHACEVPKPLGLIIPAEIVTFFRRLADTPRFRDLELCGYVNEISIEEEMQFSALTVRLPDESFFVAFRGTDDTIVGWREDFNLSFLDSVPSQVRAAAYLDELDLPPDSALYVGGHSKGGNLAVWGAVHACERVKRQLRRVWSNDGPGFSEGMTSSEAYRAMSDRITVLLPDESLVGLLLEHDEGYEVVSSTRRGLLQHDGLTWEVQGDRFLRLDGLSKKSQRSDTVIRERISSMSHDEKETLVRLIFDALESTGAKTLTELSRLGFRPIAALIRSVTALSGEDQESGIYLLRKLLRAKDTVDKGDKPAPAKVKVERPTPKRLPRARAVIRVEIGWRHRTKPHDNHI